MGILYAYYSVSVKCGFVKAFGIFGSYVRGEQSDTSDVDILVDFEEYPRLLECIGIEQVLEHYLGMEVKIVMKSCKISPKTAEKSISQKPL